MEAKSDLKVPEHGYVLSQVSNRQTDPDSTYKSAPTDSLNLWETQNIPVDHFGSLFSHMGQINLILDQIATLLLLFSLTPILANLIDI